MEDSRIIALYFERNERAIKETERKYGRYCFSVASNILCNNEDAEECVSDTYLGAWNAIPPTKPTNFPAFLARIVRSLSLKKLRARLAEKRGGGEAVIALDELSDCIPDNESRSDGDGEELRHVINSFISSLRDNERRVFMCRYFYFDSIKDIAWQFGYSESKIKMMLYRTREKLRARLSEEGITV